MDVILYVDRVLIPPSLRYHVLQILHSAHQGISGMEARAQSLIYWPGISSDITKTSEICSICCKNAPSQPSLPTAAPDIPSTPFESIWGVHHRISSVYFPQSNGRAELAVKKVKRFLSACIGPAGTLNKDKFLQGMLQIRNTPDPDCKLSPAQIVFCHPLRDAFSFVNRQHKFDNSSIHPIWRDAWRSKESAMRVRFTKSVEASNKHSRQLPRLSVGDTVFVQNQTGSHPLKWDRSGTVVDCDQHLIKIHGTGRLTLRNRKFLRKYTLPDNPYTGSGVLFQGMADTRVNTQNHVMKNPGLPLPSHNQQGLQNFVSGDNVKKNDTSLDIRQSPECTGESESTSTQPVELETSLDIQPSQLSHNILEVMPWGHSTIIK